MAWSSSNRSSRLPRDWAKRRARVLARDQHRCRIAVDGKRCPARAVEVHHLIEAGNNGGVENHDERFLIAICAKHHKAITHAYATAQRVKNAERKRKVEYDSHPGFI